VLNNKRKVPTMASTVVFSNGSRRTHNHARDGWAILDSGVLSITMLRGGCEITHNLAPGGWIEIVDSGERPPGEFLATQSEE
jgi:hypothetical protein